LKNVHGLPRSSAKKLQNSGDDSANEQEEQHYSIESDNAGSLIVMNASDFKIKFELANLGNS
jgi:hypothetical protein